MIITETIFVLPSWQEESQITRAPAREKKQRESINQNLFNQAVTKVYYGFKLISRYETLTSPNQCPTGAQTQPAIRPDSVSKIRG